jgi:2-keto-3-deoxy-L-rhamnonate aldolase RhmA
MPMVEEYEAVENLSAILQAAQGGIGIVFAGEVDLASSMGHHGNPTHPEVEDALKRLLTTCQAHNVPCACLANPDNIQKRIEMGFRVLVTGPQRVAAGMELGRKAAAAVEAQ